MDLTVEQLEELIHSQTMKSHEVENNSKLDAKSKAKQLEELKESILDFVEKLDRLRMASGDRSLISNEQFRESVEKARKQHKALEALSE